MSEFYESRRTVIADVCGLAGMAVAGFAASMFVWDALASGFRTGRLERAFFIFLGVVLSASAMGGFAGLAGGRLLGAAWERRHRRRRARNQLEPQPPAPTPRTQYPVTSVSKQQPGTSSAIVLRSFGAEVDQYLVLRRRAEPGGEPPRGAADALRRSTNLGAWDGDRLVGAVRTVSDGNAALIIELVVDPEYRRRGIGRALLRAARDGAPGGGVHVIAHDDVGAAFLRASGATPDAGAFRVDRTRG